MQLFTTLGRRRQDFVPGTEGVVSMYVCGPTVQSEAHVGHGRSAVAFDVIRRYLMWRGFEVTYVRNVTDIEDKIIAAAAERGIGVEQLAAEVAKSFADAYEALGVLSPDVEPKATEHIPEMIDTIGVLIERGLAYPAGGDVYFSVRSFEPYGRLSGRNPDDLLAGARVEVGEAKHDPLDFALWKAAKPGEPSWDSPWGPGRPGWHIECSAMAAKYLGDTFDIHGGGTDLIFPHHENELAQSEGATGQTFARYWLHNGMVNLGGEKMAKSTGHIVDLADAIERYGPMAVRLFYLRAHYRSVLEYSEDLLADAKAALERLWAFRRRGPAVIEAAPDGEALAAFTEAMDDDFRTPEAISGLFDLVREGNRRLDEGEPADALFAAFDEITATLGLHAPEEALEALEESLSEVAALHHVTPGATPEDTLDALVERRREAREERDFATSDALRDALAGLGIVIEDTRDGSRWHRG